MSDNSSKDNIIPRDDLPREEIGERGEQTGPLDVPQQDAGETVPTLGDQVSPRPPLPVRHEIPDAGTELRQPAQREIRTAAGSVDRSDQAPARRSDSILRKRLRRFKSLKRGYISFILLIILYLLSWALPLLVNNKPLVVHYGGDYYFPIFAFHPGKTFGQNDVFGETKYRRLDAELEQKGGDDWVLMPPYPWDPYESDFEIEENPPHAPSARHWLGTDDTGRDVFARMCYGFNVSLTFAVVLTLVQFIIGTTIGSLMGYFGGRFDLYSQRIIEIWSNIPFLYTVIIIASIITPNFLILLVLLALFEWIAISYYMRGEFYREKTKDYVAAAISLGATDPQIIFRHILPNSLTPLIARLPFALIAAIAALVSLDFLGFGLPPPTPSWGQMVSIGLTNIDNWWLVVVPLSAMFVTLLLVSFIGEAIREAFDPKVFSRLR